MAFSRQRSSNRASILNVQAPGSDNARTTSPNTEKRQTVIVIVYWKTAQIHLIKNNQRVRTPLLHHLAQLQCTSSPTGIVAVDCCSINPFVARPLSKHDPLSLLSPNPPILLLYASSNGTAKSITHANCIIKLFVQTFLLIFCSFSFQDYNFFYSIFDFSNSISYLHHYDFVSYLYLTLIVLLSFCQL